MRGKEPAVLSACGPAGHGAGREGTVSQRLKCTSCVFRRRESAGGSGRAGGGARIPAPVSGRAPRGHSRRTGLRRSDRPSPGRLQRPSECGKFAGWKREAAGFLPGCAIPHRGFSLRFRAVVNLYAGQEAAVRTGHAPTAWFQTGKGARQGCIWSPCLFNLYAENIMRNAGLEEAQAGEISVTPDMQMTPPLGQEVMRN